MRDATPTIHALMQQCRFVVGRVYVDFLTSTSVLNQPLHRGKLAGMNNTTDPSPPRRVVQTCEYSLGVCGSLGCLLDARVPCMLGASPPSCMDPIPGACAVGPGKIRSRPPPRVSSNASSYAHGPAWTDGRSLQLRGHPSRPKGSGQVQAGHCDSRSSFNGPMQADAHATGDRREITLLMSVPTQLQCRVEYMLLCCSHGVHRHRRHRKQLERMHALATPAPHVRLDHALTNRCSVLQAHRQ